MQRFIRPSSIAPCTFFTFHLSSKTRACTIVEPEEKGLTMDGGSERKAGKRATIGERRIEVRVERWIRGELEKGELEKGEKEENGANQEHRQRRRDGEKVREATQRVWSTLCWTTSRSRPGRRQHLIRDLRIDRSMARSMPSRARPIEYLLTWHARPHKYFSPCRRRRPRTTTCIVQSRQTISYAILELVCWKNAFFLSLFVHSVFCSQEFRMTVHRVGCTSFKLREWERQWCGKSETKVVAARPSFSVPLEIMRHRVICKEACIRLATKWLRILSLDSIDKIRNHFVAKPIRRV